MVNEQALAQQTTSNGTPPDCKNGGLGSLECSGTWTVFGVSTKCSVTCQSSYYACCYLGSDLEAHCVCIQNPAV